MAAGIVLILVGAWFWLNAGKFSPAGALLFGVLRGPADGWIGDVQVLVRQFFPALETKTFTTIPSGYIFLFEASVQRPATYASTNPKSKTAGKNVRRAPTEPEGLVGALYFF
jgi:hypothetical protein